MANFLDTTKEYVVKDKSNSNNTYWVQAKAEITITRSGKVSWKLTMTNDYEDYPDSDRSQGRATLIYFSIGDTKLIYNSKGVHRYVSYADSKDSRWRTFPTGYNTSSSGTFTLSDISASNVEVVFRVGCMSNDLDNATEKVFTFERDCWTSVRPGPIMIEDNFNNTFNVKRYLSGGDGKNNKLTSEELSYSYNSDAGTLATKLGSNNTYENIKLSTNRVYGKTRTVYAFNRAIGTEKEKDGSVNYAELQVSLPIRQYFPPDSIDISWLDDSITRLTVKKDWKFYWNKATGINTYSPVMGYRLRLYKNNQAVNFSAVKKNGEVVNANTSSGMPFIDFSTSWLTDPNNPSVVIKHAKGDFKAGNEVNFEVKPFTRYGENNTGSILISTENGIMSDTYLVQNAGVVKVNIGNNNWTDGQVYVKTSTGWAEADSINVKTANGWVDAE